MMHVDYFKYYKLINLILCTDLICLEFTLMNSDFYTT